MNDVCACVEKYLNRGFGLIFVELRNKVTLPHKLDPFLLFAPSYTRDAYRSLIFLNTNTFESIESILRCGSRNRSLSNKIGIVTVEIPPVSAVDGPARVETSADLVITPKIKAK